MQLAQPQKRFGARSLLACSIAIQFLSILSIDMYAPALPSLQRAFDITAGYLNLTMFLFFVVGAIGVLIAGPASDRLGRKPLLVGACALFAASSLGCALAVNVEMLIVFRMGEALAYGVVCTMETAIIKDSYAGVDLKNAMTFMQSLMIIGPAVAPFLGTFLLSLASWRAIFYALAGAGAIMLVLALLLSETQSEENRRSSSTVGKALLDMGRDVASLMKGLPFASLTLILGVMAIPYFAFIAVASYVILDFFAGTYLEYNVLYASICLVSVIAPFVYSFASRKLRGHGIMAACIALTFLSAGLLAIFGYGSAWLFLLALIPYAFGEGIARPMAFVVLLDQPADKVGAASSCANFSYNIITAVATVVATLPWCDFVMGLTVITAVSAVLLAVLFIWGQRGQSLDGGVHS